MKKNFALQINEERGIGSGVRSGYISQRYESGNPDPHHNVTDPQHWMQGTKDHFFLDMADDVVRGSIVLNKGVKTWPPNPPIAVAAAAPSKAGLEKTRFFLK
jgi:hypothetical protein